jgi:aspartate ammonia-lyase
MLVNDIVKDFQHPAFGIEAEQKMFVLVVGKINLVFKNPVSKCAANIRLVNPVPKSGFAEFNIIVKHIPILPRIRRKRNKRGN